MIRLDNYAKSVGKRGDLEYYAWKLFVDESEEILDQIESVEYTLHPTFPWSRQLRDNRDERFALQTAGWGEFTIVARVKFKDGHSESTHYWLDLSKPWPPDA